MKKTILLLVAFSLLLTGCQKKEESKEDKKQDVTSITEPAKPEFINSTYVTEFEGETLNDDFYIFNEDGSFYRQNNHCACYYVHEGTYEIVEKEGKKIINLRPNGDIERHLEYKDDIITFIDETDDNDKKSFEFHQGCNFFMNDFAKTDNKNVVYKKTECSEWCNYQIPMPKTGINIKLIYTGATLLVICSTVLIISLKRKKTNV